MATALTIPEQRVVLNDVSWGTYEKRFEDLVGSSAPRLTYDRGTPEIASPTFEHERLSRSLASFVEEAAAIRESTSKASSFARARAPRGKR